MTDSAPGADVSINYIELPGGSLDATKRFYTEAFGWTWTDYGPTYAAYDIRPVTIGLNGLANAAQAPEAGTENGVGPLVLLETNDLAAAAAKVTAASGRVTSGPYTYPGGNRFHFQDPAGNTLGVYQSAPLPD